LDILIAEQQVINTLFNIHISQQTEQHEIVIGIAWMADPLLEPSFKTFAGNTDLIWGGSLEDGILKGVSSTIKSFLPARGAEWLGKADLKRHLIVAGALKSDSYEFSGATRQKLDMPEIQSMAHQLVSEALTSYFEANPEIGQAVIHRFRK
jgi:DNA gyrase/topoisomerase IV subunit B